MKRDADERTDGGLEGVPREDLYEVVHAAVKDAMLDVLGTVALLGFGLVFVAVGGQFLLEASSSTGTVLGGFLVGVGFLTAAVALGVVPPFRK